MGTYAERQKADAERLSHDAASGQMTIEFVCGRVRVGERRARELKLSSRLERDGALAVGVIKADQVLAVLDTVPAEMGAHAFQERPDPPLAPIRDRGMIAAIEWDFFVFRADPEWAPPACTPPRARRRARRAIQQLHYQRRREPLMALTPAAGEPAKRLDSRAAPTMQRASGKDSRSAADLRTALTVRAAARRKPKSLRSASSNVRNFQA